MLGSSQSQALRQHHSKNSPPSQPTNAISLPAASSQEPADGTPGRRATTATTATPRPPASSLRLYSSTSTSRPRSSFPLCLSRNLSSTPSSSTSVPPPSSSSSASGGAHIAAARAAFERKKRETFKLRNRSLMLYTLAVGIAGIGITYAAVPLYRAFCSATGYSGTPMTDPSRYSPDRYVPTPTRTGRRIRVRFNADASDSIPWSFTPQQKEVRVLPGETALAFYTARNDGPKDIIGIATYNVTPEQVAPYFSKIECFCFEEQRLLANEEVDLPVFFFIDKDIVEDPLMKDVEDVILSYTFFSAKRNEKTGFLEPDTNLAEYRVGKD